MTISEFKKILKETRARQSGQITPEIKRLELVDQIDLLIFLTPELGEAPSILRRNLASFLVEKYKDSCDKLKMIYQVFVQIRLYKEARDILEIN